MKCHSLVGLSSEYYIRWASGDVFKMSVSILASLYDGAFLKLTTGQMGVPSLCIFNNPLNSGVSRFRLMNLPLFSVSISNLQLFMVLLRSFWNFVVILLFTSSAPLFEIKSKTFCSYSFW